MPRITLGHGKLRAIIDPQLGAGIAEFSLEAGAGARVAILRPTPPHATWFNDLSCYLLAPWSNRIRGAEFEWYGKLYRLRSDWPDGTAIHGLVKNAPFRIVDRSPVSVRLTHDHSPRRTDDWPWRFRCEVRYELTSRGLHTRIRLTNTSDASVPMPAGVGFHPFFPPGPAHEPVSIRYASRGRYPADSMIPTSLARADGVSAHLADALPLGTLALDDVFLGSPDGSEIGWPNRRVRFRCSPNLGHAVIYTGKPDAAGQMPAFCFEPVTMVNDGFNLHSRGWQDTGVCPLEQGQTLDAAWDLDVLD